MGIQGLLPFLKKASRPANLRDFKGQTVAIDAYCWLHKGAFSCADKLVRGEATDGYVVYVMNRLNLFLNLNIKPILVFDGCHLPSKEVTETKRRENRERNKKKAKELLREGKVREAREHFQRCTEVTSEMAAEVIAACRARNIDIIVAPYEADAQLAYLTLSDIAQLIVTEDSDLILFGCKYILFKMDHQGNGVLFEQEKLHLGMSLPRDKFEFDKFLNMCILSGCDYLPSLPGIGLGKACKFFNVTANPDVHNALCRLPAYLKMPHLEVTQEYRDGFMKARNTFLYQLVFDPIDRRLKPLNAYPEGVGPEDFPYAGKFLGHYQALQIALGNVNVQSGEVVDNYDPASYVPPEKKSAGWDKTGSVCSNEDSIWKQNFTPTKPQPSIPSLSNTVRETTKGKEVIVPMAALKRKRISEEEQSVPDVSEGDLQKMYSVPEKKIKALVSPFEMRTIEEPLCNISDKLEINADFDEADTATEAKVEPVHDDLQNTSREELSVLSPSPRKSKNPFAKALSPRKKNSANQFSALKTFNKIRKTVVDPDTLVHSRYFSTPASSSSSSVTSPDKEKSDDISEASQTVLKEEKQSVTSREALLEGSECGTSVEAKNIVDNTIGEDNIKAPLSPVQTNTLTVKTEKTFKWGKLSDMFSHKPKNRYEIGSSLSTKSSFKSVVTSKSSSYSPVGSKENSVVSSESLETSGVLSSSQQSCVSEASFVSDVGSIDNESFGLTPSSTPDPCRESSDDKNYELSSSEENGNTPSSHRSLTGISSQRKVSKSRPLGLSKPRGKARKCPDPKQLNLRDMFSFKKELSKV